MRVLVVPELYRPDDLASNGTLNDAVAWVERWLERDDSLHVYWLLPPRDVAGYDPERVLADRDRVTLVEAEPFMYGHDRAAMFTENGYARDELSALTDRIHDADAYVDVVVDQRRTGRFTLYKWLLEHVDHWAAQVRPFDVVANVHDLQVPFKYRWCSYRNEYQMRMEICGAAFADGVWFTAGVDARAFRTHAESFLRPEIVDATLESSVEVGSPLDLSGYEERYAEEPNWLHVAGSLWDKKRAGRVLAVAEALRERFGVRTVMTSMEDIPAEYREREWVDAHPEASRDAYEAALERGDLAICASEYETMARTPFEQAASGQVLLLRDEPWIYDCAPDDYRLAADVDDLRELAVWAVEHWDEAVAESRRLVDRVREVRDPERSGRRTHRDLRRRVDEKVDRYAPDEATAVVERVLAETDGDSIALDDLVGRTAAFTDDGAPLTERESCAFVDLVYALRSLGYADAGNPGTPVFRATDG